MAKASSKSQTHFECQACSYQTSKWLGRCPDCGEWNSLVEEQSPRNVAAKHAQGEHFYSLSSDLLPLDEIGSEAPPRTITGLGEFDRLLGGGMVPGSVILLGGDPGIGKSTLALQLLSNIAQKNQSAQQTVAYLSGEESADQIKLRADRLQIKEKNLLVMTENDLAKALPRIEKAQPQMLIVDSIQTVYQPELSSVPGSVSQVRECAGKLIYLAKSRGMSIILIGHVTKEGSLAGPKILEHMVDTVLYFEGERGQPYRILRTFKNRFGSVSELAVYEMDALGLQEVSNPSELFLSESPQLGPGSVILSSLKGTRPLLAELQALVTPTSFGMPRRVAIGVDGQRVALLVAILEKIVGLGIGGQDIFINVVGGLDIDEPSVDLGLLLAMASSFQGKAPQERCLILGEVGLNGEVRPVSGTELRLQEAQRLGLKKAIIPERGWKQKSIPGMEIIHVSNVGEALEIYTQMG